MIAVCGRGNGNTGRPSIRTCSGVIVRPATAMRIRLVRRAQDVDSVDLKRIDNADSPDDNRSASLGNGKFLRATPAQAASSPSASGAGKRSGKIAAAATTGPPGHRGPPHQFRQYARGLTSAVFFHAGKTAAHLANQRFRELAIGSQIQSLSH